jgi:hypothetical protein
MYSLLDVSWSGAPSNPDTNPARFRTRCLASSAIAPAVPQVLREFGVDNPELGTLVVTIDVCDLMAL